MSPLIFVSFMALFRAALSSSDPLFPTDGTADGPKPVSGVWAVLPADCEAPTTLDLATWPKCAVPVGFLDGEVAALKRPEPGSKAKSDAFYSIARTHYWVAKGAPAIVQIDVPILFNHTTVYIAVEPDATNEDGAFASAKGWPVLCPSTPIDGVSKDEDRCVATTADGLRAAAALAPEAAKTYRLVRINAEEPALPAEASPAPVGAGGEVVGPTTGPSAPPSTPPTAAPGEVTQTPLPAPAAAKPQS